MSSQPADPENRLKELCSKAIESPAPEVEPIVELRAALHRHIEQLRKTAKQVRTLLNPPDKAA